MKLKFGFFILILMFNRQGYSLENCTPKKKIAVCSDELIKEKVNEACELLSTQGKKALLKINTMRFECCGEPNYVWINDLHPRMIIHPMKPNLNGVDLSEETDPNGKFLFKEFAEAGKKTPSGAWVSYLWTVFGESRATPKKSWVRLCKAKDLDESWIVGSGTWE